MERKTGLEPATPTLARLCSTTELLPHLLNSDIIISQFCLLSSLIFFGSNRCKPWHFSDVRYCIISFTSCQQEIFIQSRCSFRCQHSRCATKSIIYDSAVFCKGIFEKIFGTVFRARFGRQPISRPCDRRRLRLQQKRRCEITIISFSRSICRGGLAALTGVTGKPYPSCLSCHSHPIRPFRAPSPRGEGCDTRIPSSKKRRRSRHESPES